jgi:serine/threonine protein kinase
MLAAASAAGWRPWLAGPPSQEADARAQARLTVLGTELKHAVLTEREREERTREANELRCWRYMRCQHVRLGAEQAGCSASSRSELLGLVDKLCAELVQHKGLLDSPFQVKQQIAESEGAMRTVLIESPHSERNGGAERRFVLESKPVHDNVDQKRSVFRAYESTATGTINCWAIKWVRKGELLTTCHTSDQQAAYLRELRKEFVVAIVLRWFAHPNVSGFDRYFENGTDIFALSPFRTCVRAWATTQGGGPYSSGEMLDLFAQIASAVSFLHNLGLVHGDLKLANMTVQARNPASPAHGRGSRLLLQLIDFGLTTDLRLDSETGKWLPLAGPQRGSLPYMAFEVFNVPSAQAGYDGVRADIYSMGVCFCSLAAGGEPFKYPSMLEPYYRVLKEHGGGVFVGLLCRKQGRAALLEDPRAAQAIQMTMAHLPAHRSELQAVLELLTAAPPTAAGQRAGAAP